MLPTLQGTQKTAFMTRLNHVLMEERACEIWPAGGRFWALILYLEMSGQVGRTQRWENYCRKVSGWILCTCNAEIPTADMALSRMIPVLPGAKRNTILRGEELLVARGKVYWK